MAALSVLGVLPDGVRRTGGAIRLHGEDLAAVPPARLRALRGSAVAMIFQEPMTALNPVLAVGEQIAETLRLHQGLGHAATRRTALEMLRAVGIAAPERRIDSLPHQFSGGMRQRAMIAMALASGPDLVVCDEPVSALDVAIQAQILNLLRRLQRERGLTFLFISHDLGVVQHLCDEVAVMYLGRIMEQAPVAELFAAPRHPYTSR